jgi:hypothetical protein
MAGTSRMAPRSARMPHGVSALLLSLLVACAPGQPASSVPPAFEDVVTRATAPATEAPSLLADERDILDALLGEACTETPPGRQPFLLLDTTAPEDFVDLAAFSRSVHGHADSGIARCPVSAAMHAAIVPASRDVSTVSADLDPGCAVRVLSRAEWTVRDTSSLPGVQRLVEELHFGGLYEISPIVFDAGRTCALLYERWTVGPLAGSAELVCCAKVGPTWRVLGRRTLWVS